MIKRSFFLFFLFWVFFGVNFNIYFLFFSIKNFLFKVGKNSFVVFSFIVVSFGGFMVHVLNS